MLTDVEYTAKGKFKLPIVVVARQIGPIWNDYCGNGEAESADGILALPSRRQQAHKAFGFALLLLPMSVNGPKQTSTSAGAMSAFGGKADITN